MHNGDYISVVTMLEKIADKNKLPEYLILLGEAYKITGQNDKTEEMFAKVKFINTYFKEKGVDTDLELTLFNINQGRNIKEAVKTAEKYIKEGNNSFKTFHTLAWAEYKNGETDSAVKNIETALKTGIKEPLLWYHAGKIFEKAGDKVKAEKYLSYSHSINPWLEKIE